MASILQLTIFLIVLAAWLGALYHFGRDYKSGDEAGKAKDSDSSGSERNSDNDDEGASQDSDSDNGAAGPRRRRGRANEEDKIDHEEE